jgi:predicted nuclease of predicted toxin-antitoxin system
MKFKLDENVDLRILARFRLTGYDVATVPEQKMTSAPDNELIEVCRQEERCLVTADRDFTNRGRYNPANYFGIAVIRLPTQIQLTDWSAAIDTLIQGLEVSSIKGKLWVIRNNSIQEYQPIVPEEKENE